MESKAIAKTAVHLLSAYFRDGVDLAQLRRNVVEYFNDNELRNLCFDLGINYDALPGSGTDAKARELVALCLRQGKLADLLTQCALERPHVFSQLDLSNDASEVARGTAVLQAVGKRFAGDPYATQTVSRLADRPDSDARQIALELLLSEQLQEKPAFAQLLQALLQEGQPTGDSINQQITLSDNAQAGDINMIGKVEGNVDLGDKNKRKRWWQR